MQSFLMFMGVAFLALIAIAMLAILGTLWRLRLMPAPRGDFQNDLPVADIPPFRAVIKPLKHFEWDNEEEIDWAAANLRSVGFVEIGNFEVDDAELFMSAWRHPRERIYACICEHFENSVWVEFRTNYKDGSTVTYSSGQDDFLDRPENKTHRFFHGESTEELYRKFLKNRPSKKSRDAAAEGFATRFESYWAEEMDWQIKQGGPSVENLRKICEREGATPTTEAIESMQDDWRVAINEFHEKQLLKQYLAQIDLSAAAWEELRDRLVFIHDQLDRDDIVRIYADGLDWIEDEEDFEIQIEKAEEMADSKKPREAFRMLNELLPAQRQFEWKLRIDQPLVADTYVEPDNG